MNCEAFSSETSCVAASSLFHNSGCKWMETHEGLYHCMGANTRHQHPHDFGLLLVLAVGSVLLYFSYKAYKNQQATSESVVAGKQASTRFSDIPWSNVLTLFLNGTEVTLVNPDPEELLAYFIRNSAGLKGTKLGCEEGGCGACTVVLTKKEGVMSVNSCLRPLCANDGMAVKTVEGVGSVKGGMSEEQQRLANNNGTQCGYCTPGWITNMHALNSSGKPVTQQDIDQYLDGNICRCTGYKPILEAFQSFGTDAKPKDPRCTSDCNSCPVPCATNGNASLRLSDMEELLATGDHKNASKCCSNNAVAKKSSPLGKKRDQFLVNAYVPKPLMFHNTVTDKRWIKPLGLDQLCAVLKEFRHTSVQLMGGNTSIGVSKYLNDTAPYYAPDTYNTVVDVNGVPAFQQQMFSKDTNGGQLTVGAGVTISTLISLLRTHQSDKSTTDDVVNHSSVFSVTAAHLHRVANSQVRNAGSWAGNMMLFLKYPTFPSDVVLALTTAKATLYLCSYMDDEQSIQMMSMEEFIHTPYELFEEKGWFLLSLSISETTSAGSAARTDTHTAVDTMCITYKVATRSTNAHAHVNAGFNFQLRGRSVLNRNSGVVCDNVRIVFGGVSSRTFVAHRTEGVLRNAILDSNVLQQALQALQMDLNCSGKAEENELIAQSFRESVMQACLYRAMLACYPRMSLPTQLQSATLPWKRPISRGTEVFLPSSGDTAVGKPFRKLEANIQCTGEAQYPSDVPLPPQGLHAAFVYSTRSAVLLAKVDYSAITTKGVVAVYTAADIPGENTAISAKQFLFVPEGEEVACNGAPVAMVVANTEQAANAAAAEVKVLYTETGKMPIYDVDSAVATESFYPEPAIPGMTLIRAGSPESAMTASYRRVKGHIAAGGQYHFYMEAQTAIATVVDGDCVDITCGTQYPSGYQANVAQVLGIPQNKVVVKCPRVGGAFGGKITHGMPAACASALAASKLGRSVRLFNTRTADMAMSGARESFSFDYEVGFSEDGKITALSIDVYCEAGIDQVDALGGLYMAMHWADNAYYFPNYQALAKMCYTNTASRTSMRAPGVVQSCLATEVIVQRVAHELNLPVHVVQQLNFIKDGEVSIVGQTITDCTMPTVWNTLLQRSQYEHRLSFAQQYNANNLWRKRGVSVCPVKYGMGWAGYNAGVRIGVSSADGTVTLSHSGCEIGQGINTKVAQGVATTLGIDLSLVRVTATSTEKVANGGVTGGSATSEVTCQAAVNACQTLNARLAPYRTSSATSKSSTEDWVALLSSLPTDVSLNTEGWYSPSANPNNQEFQYFSYGACMTEVEMDVLTGEVHVLSSEITYDCGQSLNPVVDIGQIEGGFVMALGYFLQEQVVFSKASGDLLTMGTWEYKPANAQDIPSVFNVTLMKDMYNNSGILGSKATAEPCMVLANSIYFAVNMAVIAARADAGRCDFPGLPVPTTIAVRQQANLVSPARFVMPKVSF